MQEFCEGEVHPRDGKGTLLKGLVKTKLKDGVGYFKDLTFTDNSRCIKSGKFRLGASVVQSSYTGERIREARSEAFRVKDRRVKLSEKPESPSPTDEVWCLKNIRKNGAFHKRLEEVKIKTVQEFQRHLATDHDRLLKVLGSRMSRNKWKQTIEHAQKCVSDNTLYSQNLVGDSMQLVCELPESIVEYNGSLHDGPSFPQLQASLVPGSRLRQQNPVSLITHQYKPETELNFESPVGQNEFTAGSSQLYNTAVVQNVHLIQGNSSHSFMEATEAIENFGPLFNNPLMPTSGLQAFPTVDLDQENRNLLIARQNESAALWNFVHPANGNVLMVGPSRLSDPILGQNSSNAMGHFHEQNIGYGYEFGTGGFVGPFAVGQQSLTDDSLQIDGLVDSFLASSPAAIGGPKRKRWLKVGAVLKWTVRKPIAAKA
ncbi:calmodulin-binding protein 60 G-like [Magnolia sinica]|uniref:calmodulin-binding protein 60 G-like n=1 Tax=Magnolia sinica TaxID=86752 RepID=UPI002659B343|nr:calmodulin-binding protein 60 G-like [Magnolia sinica]